MAIRAAAATAAARRCSVFRAAPTVAQKIGSFTDGARPAAMQVFRRAMSDGMTPAVKEQLRRLEGEIRDLDLKYFARFKESATDNIDTRNRITALGNQILEADNKKAQQYVTDLVRRTENYYRDIHVGWKVSFTMLSVSGAVGYAFVREIKQGWQDECAQKNEKKIDEKITKMKEEVISELTTLVEEKMASKDVK